MLACRVVLTVYFAVHYVVHFKNLAPVTTYSVIITTYLYSGGDKVKFYRKENIATKFGVFLKYPIRYLNG